MQDSWPSAERDEQRASPLPRVEDLPVVERGYEPERVREAFDAFYRHLARLDATLRTIEAVEVFRDQAAELRKELRALRTAGWTQQPWLPSYSTREQVRTGLPEAVFRWAVEACFVIAAPVVASIADLRPLWIFAAAAGAFAIVAVAEWAASRERDVLPAPAPTPAPPAAREPTALPPAEEPVPGEATEWTVPPPVEEPEPVLQQEELTVVAEAEAEVEPVEPEEPEAEPPSPPEAPAAEEPRRRRRFPWRRERPAEEEDEAEPDEDRPKHVRVLPADVESRVEPLDPWEEELDAQPEPEAEHEPTPRG